ncbi:hypothetical protein LguiB_013439 [Lonicera macranthoides]
MGTKSLFRYRQGYDDHVNMDTICKSTWSDELKWLRRLNIRCCPKVIEIQGLEGLESLGSFVIDGCKSMETLPNLSKLKILKTLDISNCEKLFEIRKLEKLLSLEYLNIGDCKEVSSLGTHLFMNRIVLLRVGRPNWQRSNNRSKTAVIVREKLTQEIWDPKNMICASDPSYGCYLIAFAIVNNYVSKLLCINGSRGSQRQVQHKRMRFGLYLNRVKNAEEAFLGRDSLTDVIALA